MGIKYLNEISYPRAIALAIFIGIVAFALGFNTTSVFDMIPMMSAELHLKAVAAQWLLSSYMLTAAVFILAGGKLGDYVRKKWIFGAGSVLFILASILSGLSFNEAFLFIGRIIQGLSLAFVLPATITIMKVTIPQRMQITAFGIWSAILGLGFASGPTFGGLLTVTVSWRVVFFAASLVMLVGLIPAWFLIPRYKENLKPFHFDWIGTAFFVIGFGLLIIGLMQGATWGWGNYKTLLLIIIGVVLLVAFFLVEAFTRGPLIALKDFDNMPLMSAVIGNLAYGFAMTTTLSYFLNYLQMPLLIDQNSLSAGIGILPFSIAIFIISISMDFMHRFFSNVRAYLGIGYLLVAIGYFITFFVSLSSTYWFFFAPLIIIGIGIAFLQSNLPKASADAVPPEQVGEATGLNWTSFYIGAIFSVIFLGNVYSTIWHHIFVSHLHDFDISSKIGWNIIDVLKSGEHPIKFILQHLPNQTAQDVSKAFRFSSLTAMKSIMAISAAIVAMIGIISLLVSYVKPKETIISKSTEH